MEIERNVPRLVNRYLLLVLSLQYAAGDVCHLICERFGFTDLLHHGIIERHIVEKARTHRDQMRGKPGDQLKIMRKIIAEYILHGLQHLPDQLIAFGRSERDLLP